MDGSAFRHLDFGWLKWLFALAVIGAAALFFAAGWLVMWLAQHVAVT